VLVGGTTDTSWCEPVMRADRLIIARHRESLSRIASAVGVDPARETEAEVVARAVDVAARHDEMAALLWMLWVEVADQVEATRPVFAQAVEDALARALAADQGRVARRVERIHADVSAARSPAVLREAPDERG
jgi:hypothetical protein